MSDDPDFDLKIGRALKVRGMSRAASAKDDLLNLGRSYCVEAAARRYTKTANADDAARGFKRAGLPINCLGNASGSLFRGKQWAFTGDWVKSRRTTNHTRAIRVWRLVEPQQ